MIVILPQKMWKFLRKASVIVTRTVSKSDNALLTAVISGIVPLVYAGDLALLADSTDGLVVLFLTELMRVLQNTGF